MTDRNGAERAPDAATEPFQPHNPARRHVIKHRVCLDFTPDEYRLLKALARANGVSLRRLLVQAVEYSVARMGKKL